MSHPTSGPTMGRTVVAGKQNIECRTKVKTGCATCRRRSALQVIVLNSNRIRKVKCDENKPFCQKCVDTGRTCDGYESPFRFFTSPPINNAHAGGIKSDVGLQPIQPTLTEIAPLNIDLLNHYFHTKTMFDVKLGCDEEARQVLQASLTDPPIRHAVLSLRALREDLQTSGDGPASVAQQTPSYNYGLQQYCMALKGLASNLSSPDSSGLRSALLCCQLFISIEQARENYTAMAQHIIRGLRIMHEYRARPHFVARNKLVPAHHGQLPFLDVFIIKLFAAPCKFADPPTTVDVSGTTHRQPIESRDLRTIAPDMRTELTRIAASTLEFLGKVSQVKSVENAFRLLSEKAALLDSLEAWLIDLRVFQTEIGPPGPEPLSVSFMRFFHLILKIVLLGALDSSPGLYAELQTENDRLQGVANNVGERVRAYRTWRRTSPLATGPDSCHVTVIGIRELYGQQVEREKACDTIERSLAQFQVEREEKRVGRRGCIRLHAARLQRVSAPPPRPNSQTNTQVSSDHPLMLLFPSPDSPSSLERQPGIMSADASSEADEAMRHAVETFQAKMKASNQQFLQDRIREIKALNLPSEKDRLGALRCYKWFDLGVGGEPAWNDGVSFDHVRQSRESRKVTRLEEVPTVFHMYMDGIISATLVTEEWRQMFLEVMEQASNDAAARKAAVEEEEGGSGEIFHIPISDDLARFIKYANGVQDPDFRGSGTCPWEPVPVGIGITRFAFPDRVSQQALHPDIQAARDDLRACLEDGLTEMQNVEGAIEEELEFKVGFLTGVGNRQEYPEWYSAYVYCRRSEDDPAPDHKDWAWRIVLVNASRDQIETLYGRQPIFDTIPDFLEWYSSWLDYLVLDVVRKDLELDEEEYW